VNTKPKTAMAAATAYPMMEYHPMCRYAVTATMAIARKTMHIPINGVLAGNSVRAMGLTSIDDVLVIDVLLIDVLVISVNTAAQHRTLETEKSRGAGEILCRLAWLVRSRDGGKTEDDMETWDAIRARRNVRSYQSDAVSDRDLDRIAEAGWRAPSARNQQHWDFVIVTDRDQLEALSTVWQGAAHIANAAAAIALVVPEPRDARGELIDQYDLGQATMAMTIAATDLGVGTGHSSVGDQDRARAILGVPDGHRVSYLLGIGYPADRPLRPIFKPNRRPFDEVVHRGRW
jgi:nitroreductase